MKTKQLLFCALFAAVTAASVFLPKVPLPGTTIMFTFQTLAVFITGLMLKPKYAFTAQLVYMALGLIGLPVFMNPSVAGIAYVLQPTFGFIIGFAVCAFLVSLLVRKQIFALYDADSATEKRLVYFKIVVFALISIFAMYVIAIIYMYLINTLYMGKEASIFATAAAMGVFVLMDIVKFVLAVLLGIAVMKRMRGLLET